MPTGAVVMGLASVSAARNYRALTCCAQCTASQYFSATSLSLR